LFQDPVYFGLVILNSFQDLVVGCYVSTVAKRSTERSDLSFPAVIQEEGGFAVMN
jgi:hypothetical protein